MQSRAFLAHLDDTALAAARRCCVAAIGPVTADALRDAGLPPDVTSASAGAAALVTALAAHMAEAGEGR